MTSKDTHTIDYRIFKYPLSRTTQQTIATYSDVQVLRVGMQRRSLCLWGLVDTKSPPCVTSIYILGTGYKCNDVVGKVFYGSVFDGDFVWHVFGDMLRKL